MTVLFFLFSSFLIRKKVIIHNSNNNNKNNLSTTSFRSSTTLIIIIIKIFLLEKKTVKHHLTYFCKTLNERIKPFVFQEYFNNRQGCHIVESDITYIRQHKMVSYENKQTPFKKSKRRSKREQRKRERHRRREGEKLIIDDNWRGSKKKE